MPAVLSTAEQPHASAFAAALLPPLEGHPSMEDVFSPADLIGPRPQRSFTGQQRRPSTEQQQQQQQRLPPPGSRGRCACRPLSRRMATTRCVNCAVSGFSCQSISKRSSLGVRCQQLQSEQCCVGWTQTALPGLGAQHLHIATL